MSRSACLHFGLNGVLNCAGMRHAAAMKTNRARNRNAARRCRLTTIPAASCSGGPVHISRFLVRFLIPFAGFGCAVACPACATALSAESISVLAGTCANCHGPDGRSSGAIPALRGLGEERLRARLMAFREGSAPDATVMTRLMKGYDEAQIAALAKWFARDGSK